MIPARFNLETYDYELPKELIAQFPYEKRDEAKLMIVSNGKIKHEIFKNLLNYVDKDDVIVINKTKVLKFKLFASKKTGAKAELMILNTNLANESNTKIVCMIKGSKPRIGDDYIIDRERKITAKIISHDEKNNSFAFEFFNDAKLMDVKSLHNYCDKYGFYPMPQYIKEQKTDKAYQESYQTVFAKNEGSIAAPTASLHFTTELIDALKKKSVRFAELILHVSYSTFKPITSEDIRLHTLDPEYIEIDEKNAEIINNAKKNVIAVGTTVLKSLESLSDDGGFIAAQKMTSNLYIFPSYKFRSKANKLITNFHLPKSSLILLTSAFANWSSVKSAYEEAVRKKYKFFSFGDAMMIDRTNH